MSFHPAYYSLIQYCPDRGRAEAANVGVLVLCPALGFAEAKMSTNDRRVKRFFGGNAFDAKRLRLIKAALEARISVKQDWAEGLADLERFIATRANDIQLTAPRAMKTANPKIDLSGLFAELVEETTKLAAAARVAEPPSPEAFARLDAGLRVPGIQERIKFDELIDVPLVGQVAVPYVYENGAVNLVKPYEFRGRLQKVTQEAAQLAVEGDLLKRHRDGKQRQLIVLPAFSRESAQAADRVEALLGEFGVRVVEEQAIDDFIAEVAQTAH